MYAGRRETHAKKVGIPCVESEKNEIGNADRKNTCVGNGKRYYASRNTCVEGKNEIRHVENKNKTKCENTSN